MTPEHRAELIALADRVEALTGLCRETDAEIAAALKIGDNLPDWAARWKGEWRPTVQGSVVLFCNDGSPGPHFSSYTYTASLDDAMTLAEDEMQPDVLRDAIVKLSVEGWLPGRYAETLTRYVVEAALRAKAAS